MSRKAKRKSGEPPGGRETDPVAGEMGWAFLMGGVLLAFLLLCLAQVTLKEIYIGLHRDDYVRDELVVSSVSSLDDDPTLHGEIASSGETVSVPLSVAGADYGRFREMQREGRVKGQRVPVWYLSQETPWWFSGKNQIRVIHVSQLEDHFGGWRTAVAITVPLAIVSVFLFLYGLKKIVGRRGTRHPTESGSVKTSYQIRKDEKADTRMLTACFLFGGAMLGLVAAGTWLAFYPGGQDGGASRAQSLAFFIGLFCVFASVVNAFVVFGKVCWFYRCPSCGKRLTRSRNEQGQIQYPCDSCRVLWDTGWESGPGD